MMTNYLALVVAPKDRPRAVVRWNGLEPDNAEIVFGLWAVKHVWTAPLRQVAAADLVREWEALLREAPRTSKRMEALGLDDGWIALAYWLSYPRLGLSISLAPDEKISCPTCGRSVP